MKTIVRPRKDEDFDVDLVLSLILKDQNGWLLTGEEVVQLVYNSLASHGTYKDKLTLKKHCVRIDYEGQFHLDVTPAHRSDDGKTTIFIAPDWTVSDPKGLIAYFRDIHEKSSEKFYSVVRMLKWWRNIHFGDDGFPKSILLTTLAARHIPLNSSVSLDEALCITFEGIGSEVENLLQAPEVPNPVNAEENLCRNWGLDDFLAFKTKVQDAAKIAREAFDSSTEEGAIKLWNKGKLFDTTFPTTIHGVAEEAKALSDSFMNKTVGITSAGGIELLASKPGHITQPTRFWKE